MAEPEPYWTTRAASLPVAVSDAGIGPGRDLTKAGFGPD